MLLRDYSRFKITVRGEKRFVAFLRSTKDRELKKAIDEVLDVLKEHPDAGDLVTRQLWPNEFRRQSLDNLFRIGVGRGGRMVYTIRIEGTNLDVDIIEFFETHKEYERRFGY